MQTIQRTIVFLLMFVLASPLCADPVVRIGIIVPESAVARWAGALPRVLGDVGYREGVNMKLEWKTFKSTVAEAKVHAEALMPVMYEEAQRAAQSLGLKLDVVDVRELADLSIQLESLPKRRADALIVSEDLMFFSPAAMTQITTVARAMKLPAVYPWTEYHDYGALMSYGIVREDAYRRVAAFVDRNLKGAKPGDLAVEQLSRYELVVNLKVAEAMKLRVTQEIPYRAEKVIR